MSKSIFASKTFWLNLALAVAQVSGVLPVKPETAGLIAAAANIAVRLLTDSPAHVIPPAE